MKKAIPRTMSATHCLSVLLMLSAAICNVGYAHNEVIQLRSSAQRVTSVDERGMEVVDRTNGPKKAEAHEIQDRTGRTSTLLAPIKGSWSITNSPNRRIHGYRPTDKATPDRPAPDRPLTN